MGGAVTYLQHEGSSWVKPLVFGGAAWLITFSSILAFRISRALPVKAKPVNTNNVHHRIRDWLDQFGMTVKTLNSDDSLFSFIVTTEGGKKISVSRSKSEAWRDYILVRGLITAGEEEKKALAMLNDDELAAARLAVQLELSRAVMGYKSDKDVLEEIAVFKNIPITPTLTEEELFNAIWKVEAVLGTIFTIGAMAVLAHATRANRNAAAGGK